VKNNFSEFGGTPEMDNTEPSLSDNTKFLVNRVMSEWTGVTTKREAPEKDEAIV